MKKIIIRIAVVVVVLVVVALAVVFFSLNSIVKKGVETAGPMLTKTEVKLGAANISPFSGSGQLTKFSIGNPEGYKTTSAMQFGDVKVALKVGSVFSDVIVIEEINVQSPEITLEGALTGKNNLTQILNNLTEASGGSKTTPAATNAPAAKKTEKKFIVKHLVIDGAKVNLSLNMSVLGGKSATMPIAPIHLENIGVAENGVTAAQLSETIMKPLLSNVLDAATKAIDGAVKQVQGVAKDLQNIGKDTNALNNTVKGVTDLFKKQ